MFADYRTEEELKLEDVMDWFFGSEDDHRCVYIRSSEFNQTSILSFKDFLTKAEEWIILAYRHEDGINKLSKEVSEKFFQSVCDYRAKLLGLSHGEIIHLHIINALYNEYLYRSSGAKEEREVLEKLLNGPAVQEVKKSRSL